MLKSWVKDKNTIVIEKQPWFDQNGPLIIYILTLYPQLNQGVNTIKGTQQRLTMTTPDNYLRFGYETFMVEFEHWVFIHLFFSGCTYAYREALWEVTLEELPADITADVPICGGGNQMHPECDGIFLVIEATEGQSNGVSRAHSEASASKMVEEPTAAAINIRADYVAKNGAPNEAAPKIFFRYYVNSSTGEKSGIMLAEATWTAAAAGGGP